MKYRKKPVVIEAYQTDKELDIETLEGTMHASVGDYIITGVRGEKYPCKPDIFEQTYEPADAHTASPWHRCEDELPPAHENLLCCGSRGGMFVGWVLGSAVCICGSCTGFVHGGKGRQFTHWMPLPEPPKEDA